MLGPTIPTPRTLSRLKTLGPSNVPDKERNVYPTTCVCEGGFFILISFSVRFSSKGAEGMRQREKRRRGVLLRRHGGETAGEGT